MKNLYIILLASLLCGCSQKPDPRIVGLEAEVKLQKLQIAHLETMVDELLERTGSQTTNQIKTTQQISALADQVSVLAAVVKNGR